MVQEVISHPALEPLALNYITFGFQTLANNLWAWITLLTAAAITFWETSHTTTAASPPQEDLPPSPTTSPPPPDDYPQFPIFADSIRSTRGKFTAYFHVIEQEQEQEVEEEDIDTDFEEEEGEVVLGSSSIGKRTRPEEYSWEAEMRLRMRMRMDLSWYGFQDLTVIDGNVVKMWEERPKCP